MLLFYLSLLETEQEKSKFEKVYYIYRKLMKYIAFDILRDNSLAEDAVQEAFIRLTRHLNGIEEIDSHKTKSFIVIVIKSAAIDLLRAENKHKTERFDLSENIPSFNENPEDGLSAKQILECIKALPENYRDILELGVYHGFSDKEISDILNISNSAARKRLERARKELARLLERGEVFEDRKPKTADKSL